MRSDGIIEAKSFEFSIRAVKLYLSVITKYKKR